MLKRMEKVRFFDLNMGNLPNDLPVFILPEVVLLPEGRLSIRITDIKQIANVLRTLESGRIFALLPDDDKKQLQTGCAVRICGFSENEDDSLNVSFVGVCRFKVETYFKKDAYDMVHVDYLPFMNDFDAGEMDNKPILLASLKAYLKNKHIDIDVDLFLKMPSKKLLATLVSVLPLDFIEKQAVLECADFNRAIETLIAILDLSSAGEKLAKGVQKC